jgi:hypothetical protein
VRVVRPQVLAKCAFAGCEEPRTAVSTKQGYCLAHHKQHVTATMMVSPTAAGAGAGAGAGAAAGDRLSLASIDDNSDEDSS